VAVLILEECPCRLALSHICPFEWRISGPAGRWPATGATTGVRCRPTKRSLPSPCARCTTTMPGTPHRTTTCCPPVPRVAWRMRRSGSPHLPAARGTALLLPRLRLGKLPTPIAPVPACSLLGGARAGTLLVARRAATGVLFRSHRYATGLAVGAGHRRHASGLRRERDHPLWPGGDALAARQPTPGGQAACARLGAAGRGTSREGEGRTRRVDLAAR
jgi:hypothetical protein